MEQRQGQPQERLQRFLSHPQPRAWWVGDLLEDFVLSKREDRNQRGPVLQRQLDKSFLIPDPQAQRSGLCLQRLQGPSHGQDGHLAAARPGQQIGETLALAEDTKPAGKAEAGEREWPRRLGPLEET